MRTINRTGLIVLILNILFSSISGYSFRKVNGSDESFTNLLLPDIMPTGWIKEQMLSDATSSLYWNVDFPFFYHAVHAVGNARVIYWLSIMTKQTKNWDNSDFANYDVVQATNRHEVDKYNEKFLKGKKVLF